MSSLLLADVLALINDVLQSIIVIFGTAVVLYNSNRLGRSEVIRAFCAVVSFVVVVYLSELLVSRTALAASAELWLRIGWIGIAMVPAAQFHLSSALLTTTGLLPHRRRVFVPAGYLIGFFFAIIAVFTDYLVNDLVTMPHTVHLSAGRLFPVFAAYFWIATGSSIYNVWRARHRCLTSTTRRRMTYTLIAFLAAPLGVFPYMLLTNGSRTDVPLWTWPILILGNLIVSIMFGILTSQLAYFGSLSPDRVVRVRLYKFMARVPLAATIVLLVYLLVSRSSRFLGLPMEVALAISMVATVMVVEWIVHAYKKPLESLFQLNDDHDVRRIQELSERLLTTSDTPCAV